MGTGMTDDFEVLRKRWLNKYITVQTKNDTKIRTVLVESAEDAAKRVAALEKNSTFSAGVRTAQIKLVMKEVKDVLDTLFGKTAPIILDGQKEAAMAAVDGLSESDRRYLEMAFNSTGAVANFIQSQRLQAKIQVAHTVNRVTKSERPLSQRVYRTKALANRWVQRDVNSGILRGDSARDIAKTVRRHIRPSTPGGVSYAALRLGRTELNNAFHATAITFSQDRPWVQGMEWHLSQVHTFDPNRVEICETYARQTFPVNKVPPKPHPQCRCFITPVLESSDVFIRRLTAGEYEGWIDNAA